MLYQEFPSSKRKYEKPEYCPHCKRAVAAVSVNFQTLAIGGVGTAVLIQYSCACGKNFCAFYMQSNGSPDTSTHEVLYLYPNADVDITGLSELNRISPDFLAIYEQVLQAQKMGLDHIVGPGLRKAVEFLVKDFLLLDGVKTEEELEKLALRKAIELLDSSDLVTAMDAAAILGNDETHWKKQHPDYNLQDMLVFAEVAIHHMLGKAHIKKGAELIESRKTKQS